jgi:hypothetical protein
MNLISEAHATQARRAIAMATEKAEAVAAVKESEEAPKPLQESVPEGEKKETETSPAVAPVVEGTSQ